MYLLNALNNMNFVVTFFYKYVNKTTSLISSKLFFNHPVKHFMFGKTKKLDEFRLSVYELTNKR